MTMFESRPMSIHGAVSLVASITGIIVILVALVYWVAGVEATAKQAKEKADKVEDIKTNQEVIKEQIRRIRQDGEKLDEKLDTVLEAIRLLNYPPQPPAR